MLRVKIQIAEDKLARLNQRLQADVDSDAEALPSDSDKVTKDEKGEKDSIKTTDDDGVKTADDDKDGDGKDDADEKDGDDKDGDEKEGHDGHKTEGGEKPGENKPAPKPEPKPEPKPAETKPLEPKPAETKPGKKRQATTTKSVEVFVPCTKSGMTVTTLQVTSTITSEGGSVEGVDSFGQDDINAAKPIIVTEVSTVKKDGSSAAGLALAAVAAVVSVASMML